VIACLIPSFGDRVDSIYHVSTDMRNCGGKEIKVNTEFCVAGI
jgi:hypothetical protein